MIYADIECITEKISTHAVLQISDHTQKNTKDMLLAVLVIKLFVIMIRSIQKMF